MTFQELLNGSPELAELKASAISVAKNESKEWYPDWLPSSTIFIEALEETARRLRVRADDIRQTARTGLIDAYWTAKRRKNRARS
jgi:hypothetical protein